jgi:putative FmdB family regulatory protein
MPVYEFVCESCGSFETRRTFEEAGDPIPCPTCGTVARRIYSVPGIIRTPTALSNAINRAEKSAHEPEVAQRPVAGVAHQHSHGRPWTLGH